MVKRQEFGFSRLLLVIGGLIGIWAYFKPFYQIEFFYARPSAFDVTKELSTYYQNSSKVGFINDLLLPEFAANPSFYIPLIILLLIPLLIGFVAIELLIRAFWFRLEVVHRAWIFIVLSFLGMISGWWLSEYQNIFQFYFFETVKGGYWQSLTMIIFSLFAKFTD